MHKKKEKETPRKGKATGSVWRTFRTLMRTTENQIVCTALLAPMLYKLNFYVLANIRSGLVVRMVRVKK